jgi:hypothetical protein
MHGLHACVGGGQAGGKRRGGHAPCAMRSMHRVAGVAHSTAHTRGTAHTPGTHTHTHTHTHDALPQHARIHIYTLPQAPSLIDKSQPYFSGVARFGVAGFWNFINDPFHTLLNLSWGRFVSVFFATYMIEYIMFAFLFWMQVSWLVGRLVGVVTTWWLRFERAHHAKLLRWRSWRTSTARPARASVTPYAIRLAPYGARMDRMGLTWGSYGGEIPPEMIVWRMAYGATLARTGLVRGQQGRELPAPTARCPSR